MSANQRKVLLFGLLGALGSLAGWLVGEVFLRISLPVSKVAGGSLASKPVLPALVSQSAPPTPRPGALPVALSLSRERAPASPPPAFPASSSKTSAPPALSPMLPVGAPAAPAPPPKEFSQRLELAGAKSGDVQITLIWSNVNDLDLHCIEPGGALIFFASRKSPSGGELDVDMNAGGARTNRPVENIYWPKGQAPEGKYKVYVHHFANHGGLDPTGYKVNVLVGGRRQEFVGNIVRNQKRLICEFTVKPAAPELLLAVSPELVVIPGGKNQLKVRIGHTKVTGPVALRLEGDLRGISPREFTLATDENDAIAEILAESSAPVGDRVVAVKASAGSLNAVSSFRLMVKEAAPELRLAVSPELVVNQGGKNQLKVRIARTNVTGPVHCRLDGDLQGISPPEFLIPANDTEATVEIASDVSARLGMRALGVLASADMTKAEAKFRLTVKEHPPELRLAVSPELFVNQGGSNRIQIRVARSNLMAPVRVRLDGDLRGISPQEFPLDATETDVMVEIRAEASAPPGERALTISASAGPMRADASFRLTVNEVSPMLRLALPSEIRVSQRGQNQLPVRIARDWFTGPVTFRLEGDLAGVSPQEFTIPAERDDEEVTLRVSDATAGMRAIRVSATGNRVRTEGKFDLMVTVPAGPVGPQSSWWLVVVIGLWTALLALGLSLALVMGQNWYLARPWLSLREFAVLAAGSLVAGVIAGGVGQALYGLLTQAHLVPEIGFLAGWLLLGSLLGRGVVFFIPNLSSWRATAAGSCGGLLGAGAFIAVSFVGDVAGRLLGAAILGFALGLMVALVETAFRKVWLEVVDGPHEVRAVNLGATPVVIGGDGSKCTVLVAGAPGRALKFWAKDDQVFCLDILAEKTYPVSPGYCYRLKQSDVVVCSNDRSAKGLSVPKSHKPSAPPAPTASKSSREAASPTSKPVNSAVPKPAPSPKASRPSTVQTSESSKLVQQPQITPESSLPVAAACPICGNLKKGLPGKRRCPDCFTLF